MSAFHFEIISREFINPSSPTPPHLQTHSLSFFDQLSPGIYVPIALFYPCHSQSSTNQKSTLLKKSLSEILSHYYPLAGRIKNGASIDCNDEGVLFMEARIEIELAEALKDARVELVNSLYPDGLHWKGNVFGILMAIQVNYFSCGGMVLSLCMSHKIADTSTMASFLNDWAAMALHSGDHEVNLELDLASLFPFGNLPAKSGNNEFKAGSCVTKRFVFDASKLDTLKSMVEKVSSPTRVEVVTAMLYKCAISVMKETQNSQNCSTILLQNMNLRSRTEPPLLQNTVLGNLGWVFTVSRTEESEAELDGLVGELRESMGRFCNTYAKRFRGDEWFSAMEECLNETRTLVKKQNQIMFVCSSWCRFPFYEVNFGWGRPIWTSIGGCRNKNVFILMDTREGEGIEAFVTLERQDMPAFEGLISAFSTCNPAI